MIEQPTKIKRPLIGISMGYSPQRDRSLDEVPTKPFDYLTQEYSEHVLEAGGFPLPLLNCAPYSAYFDHILELIDGLLLTGGTDFGAHFYNQKNTGPCEHVRPERDDFEFELFKGARKISALPIMGICRGIQLINVALGGTLYQDISENSTRIVHRGPPGNSCVEHEIAINEGAELRSIAGAATITVNSGHHQAIKTLGANLKVTAESKDGIIEAIESTDNRLLLGVQWHPESLTGKHAERLFGRLVEHAKLYKENRLN